MRFDQGYIYLRRVNTARSRVRKIVNVAEAVGCLLLGGAAGVILFHAMVGAVP